MKNIFRFLFIVFCLFTTTIPLHAQWIQTNTGLTNSYVNALAVSGACLYAGTDSGVVLSTNNGTSWTAVNAGLTNRNIVALAVSGMILLAGTSGGGIFLSTNNGTSWSAVNTGLTNIYVLALAISGTNLLAGINTGILLSTNNGISWTQVIYGLWDTSVTSFVVSDTNIFAGSWGGIYFSTSNGRSWSGVGSGIPMYILVSSLAVSPAVGGTGGTNIFAGTNYGNVYLFNDNGAKWTVVKIGSFNNNINALAISPATGGTGGTNLFAGTGGGGVFLSTNNGTSWSAVNSGLTHSYVNALAVSGAYLFVGTDTTVWRRPLSEMTSVEGLPTDLPTHFNLEQNYPNPFNPSTTISFTLPSKSFVSLKIFDALGKEVSTILSEKLPAGTYSRLWNATYLPSGVYFYRLQAGIFTETKKLVLLR